MKVFLITANRTLDGHAVYLREDREWSHDIKEALWTSDEEERDGLLAWSRAQQAMVCDPYPLPAVLELDGPRVRSTRERIRAAGPTGTLASLGYE